MNLAPFQNMVVRDWLRTVRGAYEDRGASLWFMARGDDFKRRLTPAAVTWRNPAVLSRISLLDL
jgi:hypothetical protein